MEGYEKGLTAMKALCDETRLGIVRLLSQGEACGCKLQQAFGLTQPTISYHMRVLTQAGLVSCRRVGASTCYRVEKDTWRTVEAFLRFLSGRREAHDGNVPDGTAGAEKGV